ncbi:hypothetical protein [Pseudomonas sp. zjy_11]|uniref:hypothetical protein n=1 Tax=unclassified Pseudomonas TaxID=196821 RepID=UPI00370C0606
MSMEIYRQGANRKSGWSVIRSKKPASIAINTDAKDVFFAGLNIRKTRGFDGDGEYDHEIRLSIQEVAIFLEALASRGIENHQGELREGLKSSAGALNRLLMVASGLEIKIAK